MSNVSKADIELHVDGSQIEEMGRRLVLAGRALLGDLVPVSCGVIVFPPRASEALAGMVATAGIDVGKAPSGPAGAPRFALGQVVRREGLLATVDGVKKGPGGFVYRLEEGGGWYPENELTAV